MNIYYSEKPSSAQPSSAQMHSSCAIHMHKYSLNNLSSPFNKQKPPISLSLTSTPTPNKNPKIPLKPDKTPSPKMPSLFSDPSTSIVPVSPSPPPPGADSPPVAFPIRHGIKPPILRVYVSWSRGNLLQVACLRRPSEEDSGGDGAGGKVLEVRLGGSGGAVDGEVDDAERRRIAYGSVPPFSLLQGRRNLLMAAAATRAHSSLHSEWWQYVLEYSNSISKLLGVPSLPSSSVIEDPMTVLQPVKEPTYLKAAWHLMEIFYVDKMSLSWLPESLVDWLADYDSLLSKAEPTIHSKLVGLQNKLVYLQVIEDDPEYWEGISLALAVGWLDIVVKLLRLHGSYQLDQIDNRETENGLVEAVAVLASTMPRMRQDSAMGRLGQCYKNKSDFIKAWEKWRGQIAKLDCSAFWVQCGHHRTREGLRNLLQIMLGNLNNITSATCHWMELFISHFLYLRPFTVGLEGMRSLAQKCVQLKPATNSNGLMGMLNGILGENTEVVLAECSRAFGPWMVTHAMELLTADNDEADILLNEERYNLGGISINELHRLVYAQVLSSHPLTWQIAPTYLVSCPKQGLGLLENLLYKQPVQHYQMVLKNLEICRLYELDNISSSVMKIAGMYHWKHSRKGSGVYWLQQARDEVRLNRIAQQLFECIGKSVSDDSFKQWEGLIELLGSEVGVAGGLEFLHKYRDFKRSLQLVEDGSSTDAARKAVESLIQLMRSPSTPPRFWLPLLHDSVQLLNWRNRPLLNVSETNLLLSKLQELSTAKLHPDFGEADLPPQALGYVKLALAMNLGRAVLEES